LSHLYPIYAGWDNLANCPTLRNLRRFEANVVRGDEEMVVDHHMPGVWGTITGGTLFIRKPIEVTIHFSARGLTLKPAG
jgi:hypothetical protein